MSPLDALLATTPSFVLFKAGCPWCTDAMELLDSRKTLYAPLDCAKYKELDADITARTKHKTYPKIYLERRFIGGYTDLAAMFDERAEL